MKSARDDLLKNLLIAIVGLLLLAMGGGLAVRLFIVIATWGF